MTVEILTGDAEATRYRTIVADPPWSDRCPVCGTVGEHVCLRPPSSATVDVPAARAPHRCPVCIGRGTVDEDFYTRIGRGGGAGGFTTCRSCDGSGVIWR